MRRCASSAQGWVEDSGASLQRNATTGWGWSGKAPRNRIQLSSVGSGAEGSARKRALTGRRSPGSRWSVVVSNSIDQSEGNVSTAKVPATG